MTTTSLPHSLPPRPTARLCLFPMGNKHTIKPILSYPILSYPILSHRTASHPRGLCRDSRVIVRPATTRPTTTRASNENFLPPWTFPLEQNAAGRLAGWLAARITQPSRTHRTPAATTPPSVQRNPFPKTVIPRARACPEAFATVLTDCRLTHCDTHSSRLHMLYAIPCPELRSFAPNSPKQGENPPVHAASARETPGTPPPIAQTTAKPPSSSNHHQPPLGHYISFHAGPFSETFVRGRFGAPQ